VIGWAVLIVVAFGWGYLLRRSGGSPEDVLPPLHARPRLLTWQLLPAAGVGIVGVRILPALTARLNWRPLLLSCWAMATVWTVLLALSDGPAGITGPLTSHGEYFEGIHPLLADPLGWLRTFTKQALHYPTHVAGHPPGPMMVLWALNAAGLHGPAWAAALLIGVGTSSVAAIAITVRAVATEAAARRMLPFLVLAPLAVWIATTMDALFLGVGAWAIALLAMAAGRHQIARRVLCGVMAGVLFGALPYLSYGLLPLFAVALAVLIMTRPRRLALIAVLAGCVVVPLVFTLLGFWWPDGVQVTKAAYAITGGSGRRSYLYFLIGNFAVLALLTGPAAADALAHLAVICKDTLEQAAPSNQEPAPSNPEARVGWLAGAVLVGMVVLDFVGVTRGEVERIWLPYAAWVITAAAVHAGPARRWLAAQAILGIVLQALILSPW
jgi:hypothetical protein